MGNLYRKQFFQQILHNNFNYIAELMAAKEVGVEAVPNSSDSLKHPEKLSAV